MDSGEKLGSSSISALQPVARAPARADDPKPSLAAKPGIPTISIITTCRGRLHHLRETLPSMRAQGAHQVIVVDYDCPDGAGAWVEASHPEVKVVRGHDPLGFCTARARNLGAAEADGEWLAFIDADNIIAPGWVSWLSDALTNGRFYVIGTEASKPDSAGAIVCSRREFDLAGRYDEAIRDWGGEDTDLRLRLEAIGVTAALFPSDFLQPIPHGDDERVLTGGLSKNANRIRSKLYVRAKLELANRQIGLEQCCRISLLDTAAQAVRGATADSVKQYYPFRFHRYCPACAARMGTNIELRLDLQKARFSRAQRYVITRPDGHEARG